MAPGRCRRVPELWGREVTLRLIDRRPCGLRSGSRQSRPVPGGCSLAWTASTARAPDRGQRGVIARCELRPQRGCRPGDNGDVQSIARGGDHGHAVASPSQGPDVGLPARGLPHEHHGGAGARLFAARIELCQYGQAHGQPGGGHRGRHDPARGRLRPGDGSRRADPRATAGAQGGKGAGGKGRSRGASACSDAARLGSRSWSGRC